MSGAAGASGSSNGNGNGPPRPPTAGGPQRQPPPGDDLPGFWRRMVQLFLAFATAAVTVLTFLKLVPLLAIIGYVAAASATVQLVLIAVEARSMARSGTGRNPVARGQARRSMGRRASALVGVVVLVPVLGVSVVTLVLCLGVLVWIPNEWLVLKRELATAPFFVTLDLEDLVAYEPDEHGYGNGYGTHRPTIYDQDVHDLGRLVRRRLGEMMREASGAAKLAVSVAGFSAILCGTAIAAGVGGGHLPLLPSVLRPSPNTGGGAQGAQEQPSTGEPTPGDGGPTSHQHETPAQSESPADSENALVPSECPAVPAQAGVPNWARQAIEALYRGSQSLGPKASGCPATIQQKITPHGLLVWTLGEGEDGRLQSVAVASQHLGDSLFISPAAEPVLELSETIGAVGGPQAFPRYTAGGGDYYIVDSERGSYLLLREEAGTGETAVPYLELAPSAATALIAADREEGVWLWPTITSTGPRRVVYSLRASANGAVRAKIVYDPVSGTAERAPYPVYERDQAQFSSAELQGFAPPGPRP